MRIFLFHFHVFFFFFLVFGSRFRILRSSFPKMLRLCMQIFSLRSPFVQSPDSMHAVSFHSTISPNSRMQFVQSYSYNLSHAFRLKIVMISQCSHSLKSHTLLPDRDSPFSCMSRFDYPCSIQPPGSSCCKYLPGNRRKRTPRPWRS